MNAKTRNAIYVALAVVNTVLLACVEQNVLPASYGHYVALASIVVASAMKSFLPEALPAAPPADGAAS